MIISIAESSAFVEALKLNAALIYQLILKS